LVLYIFFSLIGQIIDPVVEEKPRASLSRRKKSEKKPLLAGAHN
jgi:hypothetical protein